MLQELRNQTQSLGFKVLAGAIIVVLTLFGFGATNLFLASDPTIAAIGDYEITETVLERETERERRKLLFQVGEDFDPNSIDRLKLREYALEQLITKEVLFQTAENVNIQRQRHWLTKDCWTILSIRKTACLMNLLTFSRYKCLGIAQFSL